MTNEGKKVPIAYVLKLSNAPDTIIHHIVGILRIAANPARNEVSGGSAESRSAAADSARPGSAPPRGGSLTNNTAIASANPGGPATKNAACQPIRAAIAPLQNSPTPRPSGKPSMKTDSA